MKACAGQARRSQTGSAAQGSAARRTRSVVRGDQPPKCDAVWLAALGLHVLKQLLGSLPLGACAWWWVGWAGQEGERARAASESVRSVKRGCAPQGTAGLSMGTAGRSFRAQQLRGAAAARQGSAHPVHTLR